VKCCRMLWPVLCSLLMALPGCNHGDENRDPIAADYTATTAREVPVTIKVLANDSDPDGDQLEVVDVTQGANGEVVLNDDGTVTYTPTEGFDGTDSFTYTIDDDHGGQATGTVTVTVLPNAGVVVDGTLYIAKNEFPEGITAALGINDKGQIAGSLLTEDGSEIPAFIDADGSLTPIELPVSAISGQATGINNNGLVSGVFSQPASEEEPEPPEEPEPMNGEQPQADGASGADGDEAEVIGLSFLWDATSRSLGTIYGIPEAISTSGFKSNDAGAVVGQVQGEESTVGFILQPDGSIATFAVPNALSTFVGGINNGNVIVGAFTLETGEEAFRHGFIRNTDGTFTAFNVPDENGNALWTSANDVNDAGDIVGLFKPEATEEVSQGFLRKADGQFFLVSIPDAVESRFTDINNLGEISGFMSDEEGLFLPLILTPITPAPNTSFEDME
jgi:Big-like domain-containing protein